MKVTLQLSALSGILVLAAFTKPAEPLRLNQVQVIGSHNSYKQAIDPKLFSVLQKADSASMSKIDYEHITLSEQLNKGLLALEIDVYADTQGGKYTHPKGLDLAPGQPPYDEAGLMKQPGFKVFHIQDLDYRSNAPTFRLALQELKKWSAAHPTHHPVFITMNAKSEALPRPGLTVPEPFTAAVFDALDKEIRDNLGADKLITPDQVRGAYPTLESAVLHRNWPTLAAAQGKFVFVLDELGEKRATYIQGHPSLKGRVLFADAEPGTPEAAIHILNNAKRDQAAIKSLVEKGYIIRTRADSDTQEARRNDLSSFAAAQQSGAQIISTDYYLPSTHFQSPYVVSFVGGTYFRPNPVNATMAAVK
ncbi:hypothetical protein E4631_18220 [Hymenobacter sp. UV11]|uniref:phosphatidylinositol-specific phospholipase C1-like protein n=1 Tax=Hymenobacter sp. UV11 TaxID=1849735 RepID=UPI0010608562|nr:phosphatidylinositol-specific phospholipase C1-like protein [Hymenobacter sp. UV11]TDN40229.1 hypothetical protein A8B98_15225 [Hymenobacter sp. UV11]TFZ64920.1 hypothetical protein E4631_18220 [Hymenobacter sp. UV11]